MRGVAVLIVILSVAGSVRLARAQVVLNEVSLDEKRVELRNAGATTQDVANWWLCNSSNCRQIGTLAISVGSTSIIADLFVVIDFPDLQANGEVALYVGPNFSDSGSLADYLRYGAGTNTREPLAAQAGLWTTGESVARPGFGWTMSRFATAPGAASWSKGLPTLGSANERPVPIMQLNEIDIEHGYVEMLNSGTGEIDLSLWWICNGSDCSRIRDLGRLTNSMLVSPGGFFVSIFDQLDSESDEVALYEGNEDQSPGILVDYLAYGEGAHSREQQATAAGLWIEGEAAVVAPPGRSLSRFDDGIGAGAWDIGLQTIGVPNRMPTPVPVGSCEPATASHQLDANNVQTTIFNNGSLFGNSSLQPPYFEVPVGSGHQALSIGGIWVGGLIEKELRVAASDFGPWEFFPGPLDSDGEPSDDCSSYDRIFKVSVEDLRQYESSGAASQDLADWPYQLGAPVVDRDGNPNNYNLANGDRPQLKGDQTIWWVMNDAGNQHDWSGTSPIGLEVRGTAYASLSKQSAINNSILLNLVLEHKGGTSVGAVFLGLWVDAALGDPTDDYVGFDSTNGIAFVWNGDNFDGGEYGYGDTPSAVGVVALEGVNVADDGVDNDHDGEVDEADETIGLTRFIAYRDDDSSFGNPTSGQEAYQYLSGKWRDGSALTFGGDGKDGTPTTLMYTGIPPNFWSEANIDGAGTRNQPGERRFVASLGPFSLHPGQTRNVTLAIIWAQGNDRFDSIASLRTSATKVRQAFDEGYPTRTATDNELEVPERFTVDSNYPNPFNQSTSIPFSLPRRTTVSLLIIDPLGRRLRQESLGMLDAGISFVSDRAEVRCQAGVFFYELVSDLGTRSGAMTIVR